MANCCCLILTGSRACLSAGVLGDVYGWHSKSFLGVIHALIGLFQKKVGELCSFLRPSSRSSLLGLSRDTWNGTNWQFSLTALDWQWFQHMPDCVRSWLGAGLEGNSSLFFGLILCWMNRLSQCITCSNTQWCLGTTGSEGCCCTCQEL